MYFEVDIQQCSKANKMPIPKQCIILFNLSAAHPNATTPKAESYTL
jgi:hypothetical protein